MIGAGALKYWLKFHARALDDDGEATGDFEERLRIRASIDFLRGSESVVNMRIEGRQPASVTIRKSSETLQIKESWIATIDGGHLDGLTFAITSPVVPARQPRMLNFMGLSGADLG